MATLNQLRVSDPVLTNLALGYHNSALVGEVLMPIVTIEKEAGKVPTFGRESFRVRNTVRAVRAKSNVINPEDLGSMDVMLDEHDLAYPVDYREENEAFFSVKAYGLQVVQDSIFLMREKQIATLACDETKYATKNKIALTGTDQFSDPKSNPFNVIDDAKTQVKRSIGRTPNSMVIPQDVFDALKKNEKILDKMKSLHVAILTPELLASWFEIAEVAIGAAVTADDSDNLTDIWSKHIVLAYVPAKDPNRQRIVYEPSYGYTIRRDGGLVVDTYPGEGNKVTYVRCTDIMRPHLLGADAGYLIKDAIA